MIDVKHLSVDYFGHQALKDISLSIPDGCSVGIIGPNGAGKSTFIKALLGIVRSSGQLTMNGQPINRCRRQIAYVPQKSEVDLSFPITVQETVLTGTYPNLQLFQRPRQAQRQIAHESMAQVQISDLADRPLSQLSGGQLQRVFVARALAQQADTFFLDEPFVGIDLVSEKIIVNLLKQLRQQGKTILTVHHDLHEVRDYFDHILMLNQLLIAFGPVDDVFTADHIRAAYGDSLGNFPVAGGTSR